MVLVVGSENPANWLGDMSVSSRVIIAAVVGGITGCEEGVKGGR